jgi:hypothetical protein
MLVEGLADVRPRLSASWGCSDSQRVDVTTDLAERPVNSSDSCRTVWEAWYY